MTDKKPDILNQFIDYLEALHDPCVEEGGCSFYASEEALNILTAPAILRMQAEAWDAGYKRGLGSYSNVVPKNPYL